jgi:Transcription factor WhiB
VSVTRPDGGGLAAIFPSLPGAACAGRWEHFFAEDSDRSEGYRKTRRRVAHAKEICATCPAAARAACLRFALDHGITDGIWGGLTEDQRKDLRPSPRTLPMCGNDLHVMTPENTYTYPNGWKACRACRAASSARREPRRHDGKPCRTERAA